MNEPNYYNLAVSLGQFLLTFLAVALVVFISMKALSLAFVYIGHTVVIQWLTVFAGIVFTINPAFWGWYFWPDKHGLGRVWCYMFMAEAIAMGIASWFALTSALNYYNTMSASDSLALRWIIFLTGGFSSIKVVLFMYRRRMAIWEN